jgi:predicted nucleic acid-binding protein
MILADTSVWIEFLKGRDPGIAQKMTLELKNRNILAASAVFGELWQGIKNEREKNIIGTFWDNLPKDDETAILIEAGRISNHYKLFSKGVGLIDCALLSMALYGNHRLWTLDKKLAEVAKEVLGQLNPSEGF